MFLNKDSKPTPNDFNLMCKGISFLSVASSPTYLAKSLSRSKPLLAAHSA